MVLEPITTTKTVIELFAGAGGLALGLEKAGLVAKALIEIDKDAAATLQHNRPKWNVIQADVSKVSYAGMSADVVTGGFPCQPFSLAGKGLGFEDTRGTLFYEFARCVKEVQPKLFLAENVRGLISHQKGKTLDTVLSVLESLGYNVQYRLLNAVNYDVPQKRERVIIVGTRPDIRFQYPSRSSKILTLRDALKDVPPSEGMKYSPKRAKVLELVPPGGCWRDLPEDIQKSYMMKSYYLTGGRTGMARRISWDEPSLTLTTSPSQKQTERCHPEETRPFTVREYARIQTFPDDWEFIGGVRSKYKQIGNAVPVNFAYHLGRAIVNVLTSASH
ncbi:MAG: DNA (cytosine-5-)-methyltransferase [Brasilonema octagenarum HA4186-MV1]|jgi:DNA (cytosine-5)-methyltransferase 1|uniref:Cytosine-specific methyltransferase n=1 Tax=Brasilonema sennae CENA114 TaxID=415709 RepID=A0A856MMW5_9CYAN|nr:DNA cytosine methyltransferase [Brasilonema sennae]MBW4628794.1 DNA (cytosine-5-)-methyltransferase [Brasilonema octagenarum HA4186-MV1]QDL12008.1 DNA (cytosine-5-)-methyltransferase [Brasilonema sennae CENA114]QDL18383.1 DNA (cytosine-5-)-methyltransferase [Brasilonema octagenarum UFV-E1]